MARRNLPTYAYLSAGCAVVAAIIALVSAFEADRQNRSSLATQHDVAAFETAGAYLDMIGLIKHTAFNQDAYDNIVVAWNPDWIDHQFDNYLSLTGIRNVAIYGPGNRLRRLDSHADETRLTEAALVEARGIDALLTAVRTAHDRGEISPKNGIVIADGRVYYAVAAPVAAQEQLDAPAADGLQRVMIFLKPATNDAYSLLSVGFQGNTVRIVQSAATPPGFTSYPLKDAAGIPRAFLEWQPHKPGLNFLTVLLPVLFAMFLLLTVTLAVAARRWQSAQQTLIETDAKAAAAEEESRIKSVFFGNVSHELRTPLNAIIGFAEMLKLEMFGPLGAKPYGEYVGYILHSGQNLLRVVDDLIEFSRIEAHDAVIECENIDAAAILSETIAAFRGPARAKKVDLVFDGNGKGAWCVGSRSRLRQAISRLIESAVQLSKEGQNVTVFWRRSEGEIVVGVCDCGPGMTEEETSNIGKLFVYSDTHLVTRSGGIGLGLAIAMGLTQAMGGRMTANCASGEGCTIMLHLPAATAPGIACAA